VLAEKFSLDGGRISDTADGSCLMIDFMKRGPNSHGGRIGRFTKLSQIAQRIVDRYRTPAGLNGVPPLEWSPSRVDEVGPQVPCARERETDATVGVYTEFPNPSRSRAAVTDTQDGGPGDGKVIE